MWIRAAGFPARRVLELAADDAATAADRLAELDARAAGLRKTLIDAINARYQHGEGVGRAARNALKRGRLPQPGELDDLEPLRALRSLAEVRTHHEEELERTYSAALARIGQVLQSVASDERFREALLWQNVHALRTGVDWLLAHPNVANAQSREKQQLIASYLQRYSVKNDTIGFFGPICWGEVRPDAPLDVRPGPELLAERVVYLEHWAIDSVAAAFSADPDVKPFIAPRLMPSVAVAGTTLHYGFDLTAQVQPLIARLLGLCDGETPAQEIARMLVADPAAELDSVAEVYELLDGLAQKKLVTWTLEPSALVHPERELRRLLERITVPAVRERTLGQLARLESARDRLAAAGSVTRLTVAIDELSATFELITGQKARRHGGETYAARTPVYEDCVRGLALQLGAPVLERLGPVLVAIARGARWFSHEIATRYRAALGERFAALETPSAPITYLRFWRAVEDLFPEQLTTDISIAVAAELDRRWSAILQLDMSQSRVDLRLADVVDRIERELDAPGAGWPSARYVSPDVLVAARSVEDVMRGAFTLVLGEIHIGNGMQSRLLIPHGPDRADSLMRACELDLPEPRVMPAESRERVTRADTTNWSRGDFDFELGASRSWRPRDHVLRAADLVVERHRASLVVRHVPSARTFDVVSFLEAYFGFMAANHFRPVPPGSHVPRVTIDGVVISREQWRFSRDELPAVGTQTHGSGLFAVVRSWARTRGLPRWVFVKIPEERKPVYVDFASPMLVDVFAKLVRRTSAMTVTEMLPDLEHCWLPDAQGQLYTSELRLVALDPLTWNAPA